MRASAAGRGCHYVDSDSPPSADHQEPTMGKDGVLMLRKPTPGANTGSRHEHTGRDDTLHGEAQGGPVLAKQSETMHKESNCDTRLFEQRDISPRAVKPLESRSKVDATDGFSELDELFLGAPSSDRTRHSKKAASPNKRLQGQHGPTQQRRLEEWDHILSNFNKDSDICAERSKPAVCSGGGGCDKEGEDGQADRTQSPRKPLFAQQTMETDSLNDIFSRPCWVRKKSSRHSHRRQQELDSDTIVAIMVEEEAQYETLFATGKLKKLRP